VSRQRSVEVTPAQEHPIPFETYCEAYRKLFPKESDAIEAWRVGLSRTHGDELTLGDLGVPIERIPTYPTPELFPNGPAAMPAKQAYIIQDAPRVARQ
jgi:hypothetical protein